MNTRLENNQILLCCGRGRCPTIKKDTEDTKSENYILTDDFGGSIKLDRQQLFAIKEALEQIDDI